MKNLKGEIPSEINQIMVGQVPDMNVTRSRIAKALVPNFIALPVSIFSEKKQQNVCDPKLRKVLHNLTKKEVRRIKKP